MIFMRTPSRFSNKACGMGIVHHDPCFIFLSEITDIFKIGDDPIHRENTVRGNYFYSGTVFLGLLKLTLQVIHIVVLISIPSGLTEPYPVDDGGMIKGIGNDSVFFTQKRFEKSPIGIETGRIKNGILHPKIFGDL